ncbi:hypothetical protein DASC09_050300 [Saccharomycopsis crataegensis]|uniref:Uncharacterized protein n=1 Tax=Saccharomycopsis crataegensis TaxID=43959 RepID=A0AAV5QS17_9ASCO|nr:hypothetical protein DASC09_050300 [Saccharomycopsis crataegensis]
MLFKKVIFSYGKKRYSDASIIDGFQFIKDHSCGIICMVNDIIKLKEIAWHYNEFVRSLELSSPDTETFHYGPLFGVDRPAFIDIVNSFRVLNTLIVDSGKIYINDVKNSNITTLVIGKHRGALEFGNHFRSFEKLDTIVYSKSVNDRKSLDGASFSNIPNLVSLSLLGNFATGIINVNKKYLPKLQDLEISGQAIKTLDASCLDLPKLRWLSICDNPFLSHVSNLHKLSKLEWLQICQSALDTLNLVNSPGVKVLQLCDCQFKKIPQCVRKFENLITLDLTKNYISSIDKGLSKCSKLEYLSLSYNNINNIENLTLPNLRELDLSHNQIKTICELHDLGSLTKLNLAKNQIIDIHNAKPLPNLKKLTLADCHYVTTRVTTELDDSPYDFLKDIFDFEKFKIIKVKDRK